MYIYEGHMGGLYTSDDVLDYDFLHCEQCGDTDSYVGYARTRKEAWDLLKPLTDINGSGGFNRDYIESFLQKNWGE